jgi:ParB family chromosome partitioning protein
VSERRGIGRGLAAILPEGPGAEDELRELPVETIRPNPNQPRRRFDPESMEVLEASIEASGMIQPLLVRPLADGSYELIAGERRWRAAQKAGLERVPAVIRESAETERLQTALVENMVREDLNPVEEARACAALVEDLGLSKEEVGRRVGRSRSAISNLVRILDLPDEALELLESGELSEGHGRAILQVRGNDVRRRLARDAAAGGWSVRETENRAKLASQPGRGSGSGKGRTAPDPELREGLENAEEKLESALGHQVKLGVRGGQIRAEIRFGDLDEVLSLTRRLSRKRAA